jgi:hypothetical protein
MFPSQLRELHPSVDYEWTREVVAASLLGSGASDLIPVDQRRPQGNGYSLPLKTAAATIPDERR